MENVIREMIWTAWRHGDREMATQAYKLMCEFAKTANCPSNWRDIGEKMKREFQGYGAAGEWITENCFLYEF